jgi:hypothetical protein
VTFDLKTGRFFSYSDFFRPESRGEVDKLIFNFFAGKMKQVGIDYPWAQFLKDKKETYEFCLWSKTYDRRVVTLKILDFPSDWFSERVRALYGGLQPELRLDKLRDYADPGGPLAPLLSRKQASACPGPGNIHPSAATTRSVRAKPFHRKNAWSCESHWRSGWATGKGPHPRHWQTLARLVGVSSGERTGLQGLRELLELKREMSQMYEQTGPPARAAPQPQFQLA